jgi:hypothetical protein
MITDDTFAMLEQLGDLVGVDRVTAASTGEYVLRRELGKLNLEPHVVGAIVRLHAALPHRLTGSGFLHEGFESYSEFPTPFCDLGSIWAGEDMPAKLRLNLEEGTGFVFFDQGLVKIAAQVSVDDIEIVSNLPISNPVESVVDALLFIYEQAIHRSPLSSRLERPLDIESIGGVNLVGFHYPMAYGWDAPLLDILHDVVPSTVLGDSGKIERVLLPFDTWIGRIRAMAAEWLSVTNHPPHWEPGFTSF